VSVVRKLVTSRRRMLVALAAVAMPAPRVLGAAGAMSPQPAAGRPRTAGDDAALLATGRELTATFERGDMDTLLARATPAWRDGVGGAAGLQELRERVLREEGPETGLIDEQARTQGARRVYRRIARRNVGSTPTLVEWTLDRDGHIVALEIRPQPVAMPAGKVGY
jgi:hypothetical protein